VNRHGLRQRTARSCPEAAATSAARMIRSAPSSNLGLDCVCVSMMRPARRIDDRAVPEDRFHIGTPAPGHDRGQRWQYAEGGACVAAGARNVLGAADSTPMCHVRADSDQNAQVRHATERESGLKRRRPRSDGSSDGAPMSQLGRRRGDGVPRQRHRHRAEPVEPVPGLACANAPCPAPSRWRGTRRRVRVTEVP
jgi:hypothetical protein